MHVQAMPNAVMHDHSTAEFMLNMSSVCCSSAVTTCTVVHHPFIVHVASASSTRSLNLQVDAYMCIAIVIDSIIRDWKTYFAAEVTAIATARPKIYSYNGSYCVTFATITHTAATYSYCQLQAYPILTPYLAFPSYCIITDILLGHLLHHDCDLMIAAVLAVRLLQ